MAGVPTDLDEDDCRTREMMRIQKARVAMGELDIVGNEVWDRIKPIKPRMERIVSESILTQPVSRTYRYVPFAPPGFCTGCHDELKADHGV